MKCCPVCNEEFEPNQENQGANDNFAQEGDKEGPKETGFAFDKDSERHIFRFDSATAKGTIAVEVGAHGLWIYVAPCRNPIALVDLFYLSPEMVKPFRAQDDPLRQGPQLVIHANDHEDPLAYVHYLPAATFLEHEADVERVVEYKNRAVWRLPRNKEEDNDEN